MMDMEKFAEELKRKSGVDGEKAWNLVESWYTRDGRARRLSLHDLHELSQVIAKGLKHIRAEARTEYRVELDAYIRTLRNFRDNWDCDEYAHAHGTTCRACEAADVLSHFARGAILAEEPKEREAEIPDTGRRVRCNHCMSEFDEAYIDINATNHDSGETCPVCGKGDALMDLERKLKEAER